ncbi:hypothetical protein HPB51_011326 [Rhipicephalus microplus]|uniref:Uncharacterized protein n=1 Tax=Rhipicephalus microplus TaxID=6941 RepID=A0A9J6DM10_RHIMP|nr:hypothetical protein HPB51_011326 [Rhipicephalus microplus]
MQPPQPGFDPANCRSAAEYLSHYRPPRWGSGCGSRLDQQCRGVLLCTAGDFAVEKDMFPTDGLCELLFYTDVRFLGHDFRGRYNEKSWRTFRRLAPASRKTGFGMSVSYREADDVRKAMSSTGRKKLLQLYKGKIRHHGILRATCDSKTLKSGLTDKLRLINELKEFQNNLHRSQTGSVSTPELVLGIRFSDYLDEAEVAHHPSAIEDLTRKDIFCL